MVQQCSSVNKLTLYGLLPFQMSRDEFSARCMDITNWVMESTSTVVVPALDLTMQIRHSDSSSSSGSGSNEAREVTSLGRSVRFSFRGGPSRRTSSRTTCSTQTPTPFPSSHRYLPPPLTGTYPYPLLSQVPTPITSSHRYLPLSPPLIGTYLPLSPPLLVGLSKNIIPMSLVISTNIHSRST